MYHTQYYFVLEIAQQARARSNQKQFNYSKLTDESPHSVADGLKHLQTEVAPGGTKETKDKTSSAEGVLIDLVTPVEVTSSVLSVSTSERTRTNSILDEPIDAPEEGRLFCIFLFPMVYFM
jgi:hypothetical protein